MSELSASERQRIFDLATRAVHHAVHMQQPLPVTAEERSGLLAQARACFVTLHEGGELRGCIGSLEPRRPLADDLSANAYAAALRDPRFPPVTPRELPELDISVSILSLPQPIVVQSQQDLLQQLRPGIDGLIIEDRYHRATFLPSVWEQLPQPEQFLRHLKRKAGLPDDYWSDSMRCSLYQAEEIHAPEQS